MNTLHILLIVSSLTFAYADPPNDHGEYGNHNEWRKTMCEKNSPELFGDLDHCLDLEPESVRSAFIDCAEKTVPSSNGKLEPFYKEVCQDKSLLTEMDKCSSSKGQTNLLPPRDQIGEAAYKCYDDTLKKFELENLYSYLPK